VLKNRVKKRVKNISVKNITDKNFGVKNISVENAVRSKYARRNIFIGW